METNKSLIGSDGLEWPATFDGHVWAREFIYHVQNKPSIATDEDTLIGWFANAIMVGYDRGRHDEAIEQTEKYAPLLFMGVSKTRSD